MALIPARAGSKRIKDKNIREVQNHPLIAYTITAARESGVFGEVLVATDSDDYAAIAVRYRAGITFRPPSADNEPDFAWVRFVALQFPEYDCFCILRPTSPFRTADTIRRAWQQWTEACARFDSLRALELCKQHPGKMWDIDGEGRAHRLISDWPDIDGQPTHSRPYQTLPKVWVQNACLEIAWTRVLTEHGNITGNKVMAFLTKGFEGFDLNDEEDWARMEHLITIGQAKLPEIYGT